MSRTALDAVLQDALWLRGEHLMFHHTNPWELDEALVAHGFSMGPCEAQDLIGLEPVLRYVPDRPVPILPRMVAEGRMGKIGGVGFYRYPGGGGAVIDPLIEDLIREEAWFCKVTRTEADDDLLVTQMHGALQEAARGLLQEGARAEAVEAGLMRGVHFSAGLDALLAG